MILELYLMLLFGMFVFFGVSFITRSEVMWSIVILLSGILMYSSNYIHIKELVFNPEINMVVTQYTVYSYTGMIYFNLIFFMLALIFLMFDMFDKYSKPVYNKIGGGDKK
jgi:hypothetical protein